MPNWNKHEKKKKGYGGDDEKEKGENEQLCCYPDGCIKKSKVLNRDDLGDAQKVTCSNSKCDQSGYMHQDCFLKFETMVVAFLGRQGRARSWNDSQRLNNVWNKKGYELAFKMCGCLCAHGNLRKDLDWSPPIVTVCEEPEGAAAAAAAAAVECDRKKKKKEKVPSKPKLNQHGDWISQGKLKLLGLSTHKPEQDEDESTPTEDPIPIPSKQVIPRLAKKQTATHQFLRTTSMINMKTEPPSLSRSWSKPEPIAKMIPGLCTTAETKSIPGLVSETNPITAKKRKKHVSGTSDSGSIPSNGMSQPDEEEGEDEDEGWMKVGKGGSKGTSRRNSVSISETDWPHGQARTKKRGSLQWRKEDGLIGLDLFTDRDRQQSESKDDFSSLRSAGTSNFISSVNIENLPKLEMRNLEGSRARSGSPRAKPSCGILGDAPGKRPGILGDRPASALPDVDYSRPPPSIGVVSRPRPAVANLPMEDVKGLEKVEIVTIGAPRIDVESSKDDVWDSDEDGLTENSSERTLSSYRTAHSASQSPSCETQSSFEFPVARDFSPDRGPGGSWFSDTNQLSAFGRELLGGNRGDGKRDENGFIHCSSCEVVCRSLPEFSRHVRSPRHLAAADLNKQLQGGGIDLGGGWEKAVLREAARREEDLKRMLEESRQAQEKLVQTNNEIEVGVVQETDEKMKQKGPEEEVKIREVEYGENKEMINGEEFKKAMESQRIKDELYESKKILEESIETSIQLKEEQAKLKVIKKELKEEQDRNEETKKELKRAAELAEKEAIDREEAKNIECKKQEDQLNQCKLEFENVDFEVARLKNELKHLEDEETEKRKAIEQEAENISKQRDDAKKEMEELEKARKEDQIRRDKEEENIQKQLKSISVDNSYLEKIESRLALAEGLNEKLSNEVEDLKNNIGMFVKQVTILQETNADLTRKVGDIQVSNSGLVSFSDIQVSNTSLVSLVGELQIKNQELSEKLQISHDKSDEMLTRMEAMENAIEVRNDQSLITSGEVEKSNSFTKVRDDQALLRKNFVTLLQSCESFQYELDRLDVKNKRLENDVKGCVGELSRAEIDKEKLNIELDTVKATLHSASKAWDMQSLVRTREIEALQYNMALLYNQNHHIRKRNEFGGSSAVRDVAKRLSGDVDSGIAADRVSRSSSSGLTDTSNEDGEKEKVKKEEEGKVEVRTISCSTPSPSSSSGGVAEGATEDSLEPASEDSLGMEDRNSLTSSPPTVQARDTVASWIDKNNSRQFFKYSLPTSASKTSTPIPSSLSGTSPMSATLSVSPPMPSSFAGATHTAHPPFPGGMNPMNMWMSTDGSFLAIPPSNMPAPLNPMAMGVPGMPHTSGASRLGQNAQVTPPYPQVLTPFPYQRIFSMPGPNLYYHQ